MKGDGVAYIYVLKEKGTDAVRYVGQSEDVEARFNGHMALKGLADTNKKLMWIKEVTDRNGEIEISVIDQCDIEQAADRETYWIDHYIQQGEDLTNTQMRGGRTCSSTFAERGIKPENSRQVSVGTSGIMAEILEAARKEFYDADSDGDALRRAAIQWYRNRIEGKSRPKESSAEIIAAARRIEETSAYTIACMSQMSARIAALEANTNDLLRLTKIFPDSPFKAKNGEPVKK